MKLGRLFTVGITLVALTAAGACGTGEDGGDASAAPSAADPVDSRAEASGPAGSGGLPRASDMAAVASYLDQYTPCQHLATGDEYDTGHDGDAWGTDEADDPAWGIEERAVCSDRSDAPIALLTVSDMRKFQTEARASGDKFLVGENFAVVPVGNEAIRDLRQSGSRFLSCDADLALPSGVEKRAALVNGCFLTDQFGD